MPFCPKCTYEYRPEVTVCHDCGEKLVAELPKDDFSWADLPVDEEKEWIPLAQLTSNQMAEILKEALEVKNIPVVLRSSTGHFGETGQMGVSSFRQVGGAYIVFVDKKFAIDADKEAQLILGEEWEKAKIVDIK